VEDCIFHKNLQEVTVLANPQEKTEDSRPWSKLKSNLIIPY